MHSLEIKILEPLNFSTEAIERLKELGPVEKSDDIHKSQDKAQVLFVRLGYQLDEAFLRQFPKLRYIVSPTTGEDHLDKNYLTKKGIRLLTLKGETKFLETIPATAELTWGLLLALTRNIPSAVRSVQRDVWNRDLFKGNDNYGKTIALVGFGRIAKIITRYANAFGMKVKAYDPYVAAMPETVQRCDSLTQLCQDADILSIHAALTDETVGLIGLEHLQLLPSHAVVLNTARGDILDASALLEVLTDGQIAGAAIDVVPGERVHNSPEKELLRQYAAEHDNLLITPHLAGATYQSMAMTELFMVEKLKKSIVN